MIAARQKFLTRQSAILAGFLLLAAPPASAMTSSEWDTYFVGGPLLTTGPRTGACTTIEHPRLLHSRDDLPALREWARQTGTANSVVMNRLDDFWTQNHYPPCPPLPPNGAGDCNGNTAPAEAAAVWAAVYLDSTRIASTDLNPMGFTYAQECTTMYGFALRGRPDDPNTTGTGANEAVAPFGWPDGNFNEGVGPGVNSSGAFFYDQIYHRLTRKAQRRSIEKLMAAVNGALWADSGGAKWQATTQQLAPLLAAYGDSASASYNNAAKTKALEVINMFEQDAVACWAQIDSVGYQEQYQPHRETSRQVVAALLKSCFPGYDSPLFHSPAVANSGLFWRFMVRPDTYLESGFAMNGLERGADKFNTKAYRPIIIHSMQDDVFTDQKSWFLADDLARRGYSIGPTNTSGIAGSWYSLLWMQPNKYPNVSYANFEKSMFAKKWGVFAFRSAWSDPGPTNRDVRIWHYALSISGAGHMSAGAINVWVGGDIILAPSGLYKTDLEDHFQVWYAQSFSENAVQVWQTGETDFSDGRTFFRAVDNGYPSNDCDPEMPNQDHLAWGGQKSGDAGLGSTEIPDCNNPGYTRASMSIRGEGLQWCQDETNEIYYVASDNTRAFADTKVSDVRRAMLYDGEGTVLVWDRIVPLSNVTYVASMLHTVGAPRHQAGAISVLRGGGISDPDSIRIDADGAAATNQGGIYQVSGNTRRESELAALQILDGTSAGWVIPLEIRNTTDGTNGYILTIGGPGKGNNIWGQTQYPCAERYSALSYLTGYEFWAWGAGGPLTGWNAVPGCYAQSTVDCVEAGGSQDMPALPCLGGSAGTGDGDPDDGDDENAPNYRMQGSDVVQSASETEKTNRNGNTGSGRGKASLDWTSYLTVPAPTSGDVVEILWALKAGDQTLPQPVTRYTKTGEILAVAIDEDLLVMPSASSSRRLTSMSWTCPSLAGNVTVKVAGLAHATPFALQHDGTTVGTILSTDEGTATWEHTAGQIGTFTLTITEESTGACCAADGSCTVTTAGACSGTYRGDGTDCSPNPCPLPPGACCKESGDCVILREIPCESFGWTWQGALTDCDPNECPQPTGACCATDGTCTVVEVADCTGTYLGNGEVCSPNPCPQPAETAACCTDDGAFCTNLTLADCATAGGVYLDGQICEDDPCYDTTPRACCLPTGACVLVSNTDCTSVLNGVALVGTTCSLSCVAYPYGACCATDGTCTYVLEASCVGDAVWQGGGVLCDPNPCVDFSTGACCVETICTVVSEADCATAGGEYLGNGNGCAPTPCALAATGACCLNDACAVLGVDACAVLGGTYEGDGTLCTPDRCTIELPDGATIIIRAGKGGVGLSYTKEAGAKK